MGAGYYSSFADNHLSSQPFKNYVPTIQFVHVTFSLHISLQATEMQNTESATEGLQEPASYVHLVQMWEQEPLWRDTQGQHH